MEKYLTLLKAFQKWNPGMVEQMKQCSHHFNSENLNPYHVEGDVWTHTILMYKDFMNLVNNNVINLSGLHLKLTDKEVDRLLYLLAIIILCHDTGKIYTRQAPNNQLGKVAFYGHSFASVQPAIDFISWLSKEAGGFIFENEMYSILLAISNHMDILSIDDKKHIALMANNSYSNLFLLLLLNYFDKRNAMDNKIEFLTQNMPNIKEYQLEDKFTNKEPDIILYCGVPGVGKDTIAVVEGLPITSFDDARVAIYLEENSDKKDLPAKELYATAWEYTKKKDLLGYIAEFFKQHKKMSVCNTNLTRRLRSSFINAFYEKTFKIIYVVADSKTIYKRNEERVSKDIDKTIVNRFMYNQQIPSLFDFRDQEIKISSIDLKFNF